MILNGNPGERIEYKRGLRQGDSLSPMLFILVMDVLGFMINKAVEESLLQPLARRALPHRISIYADDVLIFFEAFCWRYRHHFRATTPVWKC